LPAETEIRIDEVGPQSFALSVTYGGQSFGCGTYLSRAAAIQAAKLFLQRKEGESAGQKRRPRKKG
jgi:hypothetical protein